jgi:hypothetical protein
MAFFGVKKVNVENVLEVSLGGDKMCTLKNCYFFNVHATNFSDMFRFASSFLEKKGYESA